MFRTITSLAIALFGCSVEAGEVYNPSATDQSIILQSLASKMLEPGSTIISDVVAADDVIDGSTITWVCGNVRGKNSYGGYAQPTPFYGSLSDSESTGRSFITIAIAGSTHSEKTTVQNACYAALKDADRFGGDDQSEQLMQALAELDSQCRGLSGSSATQACDERNSVSSNLSARGWCYGRRGEAGYQQSWHRCGPISVR
ncbi:MAG: hypothetical protein GYB50_25335 [Rhodobacteraceae bacterium]|nr:hypothetical protein [Paracoccaceae bacterium]